MTVHADIVEPAPINANTPSLFNVDEGIPIHTSNDVYRNN